MSSIQACTARRPGAGCWFECESRNELASDAEVARGTKSWELPDQAIYYAGRDYAKNV